MSGGSIKKETFMLGEFTRKVRRKLLTKVGRPPLKLKSFEQERAAILSADELLSFMRHDAHRIEKSFYNSIFERKRKYYDSRRKNILDILDILKLKSFEMDEPTVSWARRIAEEFDTLDNKFIKEQSTQPKPIDVNQAKEFVEFVRSRRSSRVWSNQQPTIDDLVGFAHVMIDAARWAPCSGNRQPWRFKIISREEDKLILKGLKEEHCYRAPCLIFIGMDSRLYGALGPSETSLYIDAGAAIIQMVLTAHKAHFGVCWNHFARCLIESRDTNKMIYATFVRKLEIPSFIEPVAIVAFGRAKFHPPVPPRMEVKRLLL